jgi:membrane protein implicated in regulation of membrane protease activity
MTGLFDYFAQHHDLALYTIAGISLVVELGVLGMSGPLLFIAIGSLLTGLLVSLGLISGWEVELLSVGIITLITVALLWKPLKKFQNASIPNDTSSDMIGRQLPVTQAIDSNAGCVSHSGIEWQARLDPSTNEAIPVSARAKVVAVDGSLLIVSPV